MIATQTRVFCFDSIFLCKKANKIDSIALESDGKFKSSLCENGRSKSQDHECNSIYCVFSSACNFVCCLYPILCSRFVRSYVKNVFAYSLGDARKWYCNAKIPTKKEEEGISICMAVQDEDIFFFKICRRRKTQETIRWPQLFVCCWMCADCDLSRFGTRCTRHYVERTHTKAAFKQHTPLEFKVDVSEMRQQRRFAHLFWLHQRITFENSTSLGATVFFVTLFIHYWCLEFKIKHTYRMPYPFWFYYLILFINSV